MCNRLFAILYVVDADEMSFHKQNSYERRTLKRSEVFDSINKSVIDSSMY